MLTKLQIINPSTEAVLETMECDTEASLRKKVELAAKEQKAWAARSVKDRASCIAKFSELLEKNKDDLSKSLSLEVGKPLQQSINEINGARTRLAFFVEQSEKYLAAETVLSEKGKTEQIVYEPLGIVSIISAWNYPYLVGVNAIAPALIAGNAVLYKPSEFASITGMHITRLMHTAGVPKDVFAPIIGDGTQGSALAKMKLGGLFFTGSAATGHKIHVAVSDRFMQTGFELGGKDPVYVCEDVNLDKVVPAVADGAFYNTGQSCCSVERIYVSAAIYDKFVAKFVDVVKAYKMGDPLDKDVYIGALTRKAQLSVLAAQVEDAVNKGAKLMTGGNRATYRKGFYFEPTVLSNVDHTMRLMRDESFGPIIGIQSVGNDEEAIRMMNDTTYGLTAGVYTLNEGRARNVLSQVNAGTAYWNCCDRVSPNLPWSGRQDSGLGTTLSHLGIRAFARPKAYHLISPA